LDLELVTIFDTILFKGKSHMKRQTGITVVTEKLTKKWNHDLDILKRRVKGLFINTFKMQKDIEDITNVVETNVESINVEEEFVIEVK